MTHNQAHLWLSLFESVNAPGLGLRERLCAALRQAIHTGNMALHARMPATRVLAQDLSISRVTVEAAYTQLETEGYLHRKVGDGSFVAIDMAQGTVPSTPRARRSTLQAIPATRPLTLPVAVSRRGQRMVDTGGCMEPQKLQAFAAGSPDLRAFPVDVWRRLTQRRLREDAAQLMRYGDPQGRADLRAAIAQYLIQSRGVRCTPEQVLVLTSSQQALQLLATMLLDEGDVVWMENPGYAGARTAFKAAGAQLVNLRIDDEGAVLDGNLSTPRMIYLTPSHQFPTGQALSLKRRLAFIAYAKQCGAWLIEDDYDSEFLFDGRPTPALQGLDTADRVLYIGTFSKALFPSLRLAYAVLPPALVSPTVIARSMYDGHPAQLMQAVTADFITQGHFAAHLRLMRQLYRSRRDTLLDALHQYLPWAQPFSSVGGLQLSVRLPVGSETALTRQAATLGIATPSLSALYHAPTNKDGKKNDKVDGWRLGYAALQPTEIVVGVKLLSRITPPASDQTATPARAKKGAPGKRSACVDDALNQAFAA